MGMGRNGDGQPGDGTIENRHLPITIDANVIAISAGIKFSLYINSIETFESWLERYFDEQERLNASVAGENADPDDDGHTNRFEFLANLNPVDAESRIRFTFEDGP